MCDKISFKRRRRGGGGGEGGLVGIGANVLYVRRSNKRSMQEFRKKLSRVKSKEKGGVYFELLRHLVTGTLDNTCRSRETAGTATSQHE